MARASASVNMVPKDDRGASGTFTGSFHVCDLATTTTLFNNTLAFYFPYQCFNNTLWISIVAHSLAWCC